MDIQTVVQNYNEVRPKRKYNTAMSKAFETMHSLKESSNNLRQFDAIDVVKPNKYAKVPNKYDTIFNSPTGKSNPSMRKDMLNNIHKEMLVENPHQAMKEIKMLENSAFYKKESAKKGTDTKKILTKIKNEAEDVRRKGYSKDAKEVTLGKSERYLPKGLKVGGAITMGLIATTALLDASNKSKEGIEARKEVNRQEDKIKDNRRKAGIENPTNFREKVQSTVVNGPDILGQTVIDMFNERIGHYKMGGAKEYVVGGTSF